MEKSNNLPEVTQEVMKPSFEPKHSSHRPGMLNCCTPLPLTAAVSRTGWLVAKVQRSVRCLVVANEVLVQKLPSCPALQRKTSLLLRHFALGRPRRMVFIFDCVRL